MRRGGLAVAIAAAATAAALFICEVMFRVFLVEPAVPLTQRDFDQRIAASWPRPIAIERNGDIFRILGLADSFGRAGKLGNYHYLLEEGLRLQGVPAEVINISGAAFEPSDELLALERFGLRYHPDIVLHGFFVGNDFSTPLGALVEYAGILMRVRPGLESWLPHQLLLVKWLHHRGVIIRDDLRKRLEAARPLAIAFAAAAPDEDDSSAVASSGAFSEAEFLQIERRRLEICRERPAESWNAEPVFRVLDSIREVVERKGGRYVGVIHPDQLQVEVPLRRRLADAFSIDIEAGYDLEAPQRAVLAYCASRQIPCLDLLPSFRARGAAGGLYQLRDTHYNAEGNRLAASVIQAFLHQRNLTRSR